MTEDDKRRVLRLFGLGCSKCSEPVLQENDRDSRLSRHGSSACPDCDGSGYSLKEATRGNWPWWRFALTGDYSTEHEACMPDFLTNPAASVRLAEEMDCSCAPYKLHGIQAWEITYDGTFAGADTLGEALLKALEAADGA